MDVGLGDGLVLSLLFFFLGLLLKKPPRKPPKRPWFFCFFFFFFKTFFVFNTGSASVVGVGAIGVVVDDESDVY